MTPSLGQPLETLASVHCDRLALATVHTAVDFTSLSCNMDRSFILINFTYVIYA